MIMKFSRMLISLICTFFLISPDSIAMEIEEGRAAPQITSPTKAEDDDRYDGQGAIADSHKEENPTSLRLRSRLKNITSGVNVKIEEINPLDIKSMTLVILRNDGPLRGEPDRVFLVLPKSLEITQEPRPKPTVIKLTKAQSLQTALDRLLQNSNSHEGTALRSYTRLPKGVEEDTSPNWDSSNKFMEELDRLFFITQPSSGGLIAAKVIAGLLGLVPPIPVCGVTLYSIGNVFGFPPGEWLSDLLSVWITVTDAPIATRQFVKRVDKIFDKNPFMSFEEDEEAYNKAVEAAEKKAVKEFRSQNNNPGASHTDNNQLTQGLVPKETDELTVRQKAAREVEEGYKWRPHVFKKSKTHKVAHVFVILSAVTNAGIPALLAVDAYQAFDETYGFPWGKILAFFVFTYYSENPLIFAEENLWYYFSRYSYIGSMGQTSEEDSRKKREILVRRMEQFLDRISDPKNKQYTQTIYQECLAKIERLKSAGTSTENSEEDISAFSLLMLKSMRIEDESEGEAQKANAMNFKIDLNVIKISWLDDLVDFITAAIIGAGFFADAQTVQYMLTFFLQEIFGIDEITTEEIVALYLISYTDVALRSVTEFKLHQHNLKSWLNVFSLKHKIDFQWVRKGLGLGALINSAIQTLPRLFVTWTALQNYPLIGRIVLLIPSVINNFSLNQAIFSKHYNDIVTDVATLKANTLNFDRQRAQLKAWALKAIQLTKTRFDDETIEKAYSAIHQGL